MPKGSERPKNSKGSNKRLRDSPPPGNRRHGPRPTTSTQGGRAAHQQSSRRGDAPLDDSTFSDLELQRATTSMGTLSMGAPVNPQGGPVLYDQYGPIATSTPGSINPDAIPSGNWSIDQRERSRANPSAQYGQFGTNVPASYGQPGTHMSAGYGQSGTHLPAGYGQPSAYLSSQPGRYPASPSVQPRQSSAYSSSQSRQQQSADWDDLKEKKLDYYKKKHDKNRKKWSLVAEAMSKHFKQDITPLECSRHWESAGGRAKRKLLAADPDSSDSSSEEETSSSEEDTGMSQRSDGWSKREDQELVYLKGEYDQEYKKWELVARGMARATFSRTEKSCRDRWNSTLKAKYQNLKPNDWSKEDDDKLTKLVKNFREWKTLYPWDIISEQMGMLGSRHVPEYCRARWQDTLRGPATFEKWSRAEEELLLEFNPPRNIVELIDELERSAGSIRTVDFTRAKLDMLRKAIKVKTQKSTIPWSPEAVFKLREMYQGQKRCDYKKGAERLNDELHTNIFTTDEVRKKWSMIK